MGFLELDNLGKSFRTSSGKLQVLSGINLSISKGEFVAVVGYSGAGKTTLMSCLAGLIRPDEGQVRLNGSVVKEPGPDRAVVFQNYSLLPWLSVFDNVLLAVDQVAKSLSRSERRARVEHYIDMVGLTPARHKTPSELSGGMRQRVSVAQALAMRPQVLLMDEPFSALDALTRASLQDELTRIFSADKTTVVMVTNDVDEGILLADRIVPLSMGPAATLGPEVAIDIERPRDRKGLNHDPRFRRIRKEVFDYLLGPGRKTSTAGKSEGNNVAPPSPPPMLVPKSMAGKQRRSDRQLTDVAA